MEGVPLDWAAEEKLLGVEHQYVGGKRRTIDTQRSEDAAEAALRHKRLPLGWELKELLVLRELMEFKV